jgi:hypothetical protein
MSVFYPELFNFDGNCLLDLQHVGVMDMVNIVWAGRCKDCDSFKNADHKFGVESRFQKGI